jgi:hypothetical protein
VSETARARQIRIGRSAAGVEALAANTANASKTTMLTVQKRFPNGIGTSCGQIFDRWI